MNVFNLFCFPAVLTFSGEIATQISKYGNVENKFFFTKVAFALWLQLWLVKPVDDLFRELHLVPGIALYYIMIKT